MASPLNATRARARSVALLLLLPLVGVLAACATGRSSPAAVGSWAEPAVVRGTAAGALAAALTAIVADRLPPATSTLVLIQADAKDAAAGAFAAVFTACLRRAGFALAAPDAAPSDAHRLRYLVTPLDGAVLLRVQLDRVEAARLYRPNAAGVLVAVAPLTVREAPAPAGIAR